ncbi:hypothetical protein ACFLRP_05400 [Bacteroidota bacterium]
MRLSTWVYMVITIILVVCSLAMPANPASANNGMQQWLRLTTPQDGPGGNWVLANNGGAGTEVNHIAVGSDGNTIYALDSVTPLLFKSSDGGYTWLNITGSLPAFASLDDLAVSPDNPEFLVAVDATTPEVFLSTDGGTSFSATAASGLTITGTIEDIAISGGIYSTSGRDARSIMFGTSNSAGGGQLWMMSVGPQYHNWTNVSSGATGWSAADIFSLAYSPSYPGDRTVLLITADNVAAAGDIGNPGTTWLYIGRMDAATFQMTWNASLLAGYPLAISRNEEDSPGTPLSYASMALPPDYSITAESQRRVYASWSDDTGGNANDDVYRLDDVTAFRLEAGNGMEYVGTSLAYHGTLNSGKLMAGSRATSWAPPEAPHVQVRHTSDPQSRMPTWQNSNKPPTGINEAQVAWSPNGRFAFCGTGTIGGATNDDSAFSRSTDDGSNWNQTGLIDTVISTINDIEVSPDTDSLFMTTVNTGAANADGLWRSISNHMDVKWERVLARSSTGTGDNPLIRIDPDYTETGGLWYANIDSTMASQQLFRSRDGGNSYKTCFPNLLLVDIAVEDEETVYGVDAVGLVSKGIKGGRQWGAPVGTQLDSGYSIACARTTTTPDNPYGSIIVGGNGTGSNGDVAYSTDGGATFTPIETMLPTRDNTVVVASSSYTSDGTILAINSGGMYAWGIFAGKSEWETWWGGISSPSAVLGLHISRSYGLYFSTPASAWGSATPYIRWSGASAGLDANINLGAQPSRKVALSGGMELNEPTTFWIIDQRAYSPTQGGIWHYTDSLSWLIPVPITPASGSEIDYDPVSGRADQFYISWESNAISTGYQIQIAMDENFSSIAANIGGAWAGPFYRPADPGAPALSIPAGGGAVSDAAGNTWTVTPLLPGQNYYWRVRVKSVSAGDNIQSSWSWVESFTVKQGMPVRSPQ